MRRPLWIIIVCAGACVGLTLGFRQALGLFLTPISLDTGMGREVFALSLGLASLFWGITAPFAGAIADKLGAGRVAAVGGICYAAGLAAMTLSGEGGQMIVGGMLIGSFLGAWLAGHFYDLLGNYDAVWWLCVAIGLISAALHWPIAERPVARVAAAEAVS